jgi:hypothetical protein
MLGTPGGAYGCIPLVGHWTSARAAVITAAYGDFERSTKAHAAQTMPVDFFCFTNYHGLHNTGNWMLVFAPYHALNVSTIDQGQWVNSRAKNTHPYMTSKFYKTQFHRIPFLARYEMIIWIDMTIVITSPFAVAAIWRLFEEFPDRQILIGEHPFKSRHCMLGEEAKASLRHARWNRQVLRGHPQPFQNVSGQYDFYVRQGYSEEYWRRENRSYFAGACTGLWQTDMMGFRMTDPLVPKLLDAWYTELLNWTTQCQLSFPYVVQRFGVYPISCPTRTFDHLAYFTRRRHGE